MITVTETKGKSSDRPSIKKQQRDLRVVGSVSAGFLGLPESTADVSSLHLSFFFTHLLPTFYITAFSHLPVLFIAGLVDWVGILSPQTC